MRMYFANAWAISLLLLAAPSAWAVNHNVAVGGSMDGGYYGGSSPILMFQPSSLTINVGDTVTFTNNGGPHNVHADDGSFRCASGCDGAGGDGTPVDSGWHSTVTFNHAGAFPYHCDVHGGMGMTGLITVQAPASGNVPITSGFTGSWVDAGGRMGFGIEVLANGNLVAEGYTFRPEGGQIWIGGVGPIVGGDHAVISMSTTEGTGGRFAPNFDQSQVHSTAWGTMTFTFADCGGATVAWSSILQGYGDGSIPLIRLTQPAGITCP